MKHNDIQRTEANSKEIRGVEYLAALDAKLADYRPYLEERLKSVPDIYRQYRIAETAMSKVVNNLYDTLEPNVLFRIRKLREGSELVFRPKSPLNKSTDSQLVLEKDLDKLINAAMSATCACCLKTGREAKKCELRKALMNICPPNTLSIDSMGMCDYAIVAATNDLGGYI